MKYTSIIAWYFY